MTDLLNACNDINTNTTECSVLVYLFILDIYFLALLLLSLGSPPIMLIFSPSANVALVKVINDLHVDKPNGQSQCSPYLIYKQR